MFQFRRFPSYAYFVQRRMTGYCPAGLPHSDIPGSMDICSSPRLFAACHVLLRRHVPRHPPYALCSLIFFVYFPLAIQKILIFTRLFDFRSLRLLPVLNFAYFRINQLALFFIFLCLLYYFFSIAMQLSIYLKLSTERKLKLSQSTA